MSKLKETLTPFKQSERPKTIKFGHTYPHGVSRQYTADMRKYLKAITQEIKSDVLPELKAAVKERDERQDSDERMDGLADVVQRLRRLVRNIFPGERLAQEFASRTYDENESKIAKSVEESLGVAVPLPGGDRTILDDWIVENTSLIEDLQEQYIKRIQNSVGNGFNKGLTYREIAKNIQRETNISWRRARTIARDQVGTLNGLVTKERNKELGIEKAEWVTVGDERVRGNPSGLYPDAKPSHYARNGQEFDWDKGIDGEFPGTPILCRCFARSKVEI